MQETQFSYSIVVVMNLSFLCNVNHCVHHLIFSLVWDHLWQKWRNIRLK